MIQFFLIVNRTGQTRFARYYQTTSEKPTFELEIARACITRKPSQVIFVYMYV